MTQTFTPYLDKVLGDSGSSQFFLLVDAERHTEGWVHRAELLRDFTETETECVKVQRTSQGISLEWNDVSGRSKFWIMEPMDLLRLEDLLRSQWLDLEYPLHLTAEGDSPFTVSAENVGQSLPKRAEIILVVGPSGSGKTTWMRSRMDRLDPSQYFYGELPYALDTLDESDDSAPSYLFFDGVGVLELWDRIEEYAGESTVQLIYVAVQSEKQVHPDIRANFPQIDVEAWRKRTA